MIEYKTLYKKPKIYYCTCDICGERNVVCIVLPVKSDLLFVCKKCNTPPLSDKLVKLTAEDYGIND